MGLMKKHFTQILAVTLLLITSSNSFSVEPAEFVLEVKDGIFIPEKIEVPQGQKVKLSIKNSGVTAEEFESKELNREKIIPAGKTVALFIGPLSAGEYEFFGEFHPTTARGKILVK